MDAPDRLELEAAHCWERVDVVPGDPATTAFKRRARLHQARWRERNGFPVGSEPYLPKQGQPSRTVGSRLAHDFAVTQKSNLISAGAKQAAVDRLANREHGQMLNEMRLWCDLLSSMPLCFNLFGPLAADRDLARRAVAAWFPDAPGLVTRVRLEWSPARLDSDYLGNRTAFDAAIELDLGGGQSGIIGIETKYHEHLKREAAPSPQRMKRYKEVADESAAFTREHLDDIVGGPQQQIWQDHLLALAMLQHRSKQWAWARFVVVYPSANPSFDHGVREYADRLADRSTFDHMTLESLLDHPDGFPSDLAGDLRSRYLW